jgi:CO/xanthine dehydrogenase FAD-binding subunit
MQRLAALMRGNAEAHELIAPGSLGGVLELMAGAPGEWTPIAGGTEIMVAHAAGRLREKRLVSLWGLRELRFIGSSRDSIAIGAGVTFRDLRAHAGVESGAPLLAKAATWIGSIANQNRATIGGNLVNGSPAADSSPALLVYDAEVELISVRGRRRIAYSDFHTGYKRNAMAADELMFAVHVPLRFANHKQYLRKVGTRRAMAISKVALAGTAMVDGEVVSEIRFAAASLAPFPARLYKTEAALLGRTLDEAVIREAQETLMEEAKPIDDIRSTAAYRGRVAANLLGEFLNELMQAEARR